MFRKFEVFDQKIIGYKKNITIICATSIDNKFWILIINNNKSKLLLKDIEFFELVCDLVSKSMEHNFAIKALLFNNQICSKAKQNLKNLKWKIYDDFV
jgi:hypothetical protein